MKRKDYGKYFVRVEHSSYKRDITKLCDDAPEELKDFVREIHLKTFDGAWPNDWIYEQLGLAFDELSENELDQLNIEPDIYYSDLYAWLGNSFAPEFVGQWLEMDNQNTGSANIFDFISGGNWMAKRVIYDLVNDFINEEVEDDA